MALLLLLLKLIVLFGLVAAIYFILNKKNDNNNLSVKDLTASLIVDDATTDLSIQIKYTNPSSFGPNGAIYNATLFYILDGIIDRPPKHPSVDDLFGQTYKLSDTNQPPYVTEFDGTNNNSTNANVTGYLNKSFKLSGFSPTSGSKYTIGIAIMNDQQSGNTQLPGIYGDFVYTTISATDTSPPGDVSITSGEITKN
jgi:hypothetical protein